MSEMVLLYLSVANQMVGPWKAFDS